MEFGNVKPPEVVIASSQDDKFTTDTFRNFLESKSKYSVKRVRTTDEGFILAKFKDNSGMCLKSLLIEAFKKSLYVEYCYDLLCM